MPTFELTPIGAVRNDRAVVDLDTVSGTAVIDLEPATAGFLPGGAKQPEWVSRVMSACFQP